MLHVNYSFRFSSNCISYPAVTRKHRNYGSSEIYFRFLLDKTITTTHLRLSRAFFVWIKWNIFGVILRNSLFA